MRLGKSECVVLVWLGTLELAGCDNSAPSRRSLLEPQPATRAVSGADASDLPGIDPPALTGDLAADVEGFTTLDACVERHARVDPLVGDALEAIGYDTLFRDACRMLEAAKAKDSKRCLAIETSPLRERCLSAVAELAGEPDACPWRFDSRKELGRDPGCLALASRDERLCAAVVDGLGRTTCSAIARHAPSLCQPLLRPMERARCAREAERWGSLVPADDGRAKLPPLRASGTLTLSGNDAGVPRDVDLAGELSTGVVVVRRLDNARVALGPLHEDVAGFLPASPQAETTFALDLAIPRGGESGGPAGANTKRSPRVERAELQLPARLELRAPPALSTLVVTVTKLEETRGGAVELSVDGDLGDAQSTCHVHARLATFVRDVVTAEALFDVGPRRFGAGTEMR